MSEATGTQVPPSAPAIPALIKDLAGASSLHAKAANQFWIALVTASFLVAPTVSGAIANPSQTPTLPFGLGTISWETFYPLAIALQAILTVAFSAAHAQLVRTDGLVEEALRLTIPEPSMGGLNPRDVLDALRESSFLRLAPLAQVGLGGRQHYFHQVDQRTRLVKWAGRVHYSTYKALSNFIYVGVPAFALYVTFSAYEERVVVGLAGPVYVRWAIRILTFLAAIALLQIVVLQVRHQLTMTKRIGRKPVVVAEVSEAAGEP